MLLDLVKFVIRIVMIPFPITVHYCLVVRVHERVREITTAQRADTIPKPGSTTNANSNAGTIVIGLPSSRPRLGRRRAAMCHKDQVGGRQVIQGAIDGNVPHAEGVVANLLDVQGGQMELVQYHHRAEEWAVKLDARSAPNTPHTAPRTAACDLDARGLLKLELLLPQLHLGESLLLGLRLPRLRWLGRPQTGGWVTETTARPGGPGKPQTISRTHSAGIHILGFVLLLLWLLLPEVWRWLLAATGTRGAHEELLDGDLGAPLTPPEELGGRGIPAAHQVVAGDPQQPVEGLAESL